MQNLRVFAYIARHYNSAASQPRFLARLPRWQLVSFDMFFSRQRFLSFENLDLRCGFLRTGPGDLSSQFFSRVNVASVSRACLRVEISWVLIDGDFESFLVLWAVLQAEFFFFFSFVWFNIFAINIIIAIYLYIYIYIPLTKLTNHRPRINWDIK